MGIYICKQTLPILTELDADQFVKNFSLFVQSRCRMITSSPCVMAGDEIFSCRDAFCLHQTFNRSLCRKFNFHLICPQRILQIAVTDQPDGLWKIVIMVASLGLFVTSWFVFLFALISTLVKTVNNCVWFLSFVHHL